MEALLELLIRLIIIMFFGGTSTSMNVLPPSDFDSGPPSVVRSYTYIQDVELIALESQPPQVQLHVKGEHPDGCDYPAQVTQQRDGNTITVEIYREVPFDVMCPMILLSYEDTIKLDGTFPPGNYTFKINDYVFEREL